VGKETKVEGSMAIEIVVDNILAKGLFHSSVKVPLLHSLVKVTFFSGCEGFEIFCHNGHPFCRVTGVFLNNISLEIF